jgi:predicted methyltransferase
MKRSACFLVISILALGLFATQFPQNAMAERGTIIGTVAENGLIETEERKNYIIDMTGKGEELAQHVGKKVKVTGDLEDRYGGSRAIKVISYEVLE